MTEIRNEHIIADLHVHTQNSFHAYNSLRDNLAIAEKRGLMYIAITDHFLGDSGYGVNVKQENARLQILQNECARVFGKYDDDRVGIIAGVEMNVGQAQRPKCEKIIGLKIGGYHSWFLDKKSYSSPSELANMFVNSGFDIICHPERNIEELFKLESEKIEFLNELVNLSAERGIIIEVNETSLGTYKRKGYVKYMSEYLKIAKEKGVMISLGTDSHVDFQVGMFTNCIELLNSIEYPVNLIVNADKEWLAEKTIRRDMR